MNRIIKWCIAAALCGAVYVSAQSQIDGIISASTSSVFNFASAATTRVMKVATSDPGTCTVGDLLFRSDATAGSNIKGCTSTNTWTAQGGSGSGGGSTIAFTEATGVAQNSTRYAAHGVTATHTSESARQINLPRDGTLKNLYVRTLSNIGGSGDTATFTVRINGGDTSLTCTINTGSSTCNDVNPAHAATVTAGDLYSFKVVSSATTGTYFPFVTVSFE